MDLVEAIRARRSIRAYQERTIEEDLLTTILSCANAAPSAGNLQPFEIVVVRDKKRRLALSQAALGQSFLAQAPVVLVFLEDPARSAARYGDRGADLYCTQDAAIACAYAQLAATHLGLGTCWVGAFRTDEVRRTVGAPSSLHPTAMLCVGHAAEQPPPTGRRPLDDLVHHETLRTKSERQERR